MSMEGAAVRLRRKDKRKTALKGIEFCDETGELCSAARCAEMRLEDLKTNAYAAGIRRMF